MRVLWNELKFGLRPDKPTSDVKSLADLQILLMCCSISGVLPGAHATLRRAFLLQSWAVHLVR